MLGRRAHGALGAVSGGGALYLSADMYGNRRQFAIYIMEKKPLLTGKAPGITRALSMTRFSAGMPVMWGTSPNMYMIQDDTNPPT